MSVSFKVTVCFIIRARVSFRITVRVSIRFTVRVRVIVRCNECYI